MKLKDFKNYCLKDSGRYDYDKARKITDDALDIACDYNGHYDYWKVVDSQFLLLCSMAGLDIKGTTRSTIEACFHFARGN